MRTARFVATIAAAVAALATVGAASATAPPTGETEEESAFEFAQCMRDNGIADFPDPEIRADGDIQIRPPADVALAELETADAACAHILPPPDTEADEAPNPLDLADWEQVVPGGDCQCSDGSEFNFWVRQADPDKVVLYFQDGGACFSAETCAPDSDVYDMTVDEDDDHPANEGGIFDFADERNPFADYSVVYVPYCTGDVFLGNTTTEYAPGLTIQHKGYVNGTAALDHLAATFPGATDVVVIGGSAGSVAAPFYAGLVSDRLPDAGITVLADGSGSYPDVSRLNEIIAAWGFGDVAPDWPANADLSAEPWSFPGLFIQSGRHDPDIVFARIDHAYDERQAMWYPIAGIPMDDLLQLIDANEAQIEDAGVNVSSYVAPGDEHTVLTDGTFYTEEVNGQLLMDWVTRLIAGEPVDDVHCTECAAG